MTRLLAVVTALFSMTCVAVLSGCASLPESGPVHRQAADQPDRPQDAPYFNPPGPAKDGSPAAIVSGFLVSGARLQQDLPRSVVV